MNQSQQWPVTRGIISIYLYLEMCVLSSSEPTGNVFIADVGQNRVEEIDIMYPDSNNPRNGLNYGWAAFEGTECFKSNLCGDYGRTVY